MRRLNSTVLLFAAAMVALPGSLLAARNPSAQPQAAKPAPQIYRVDYHIYELANGKRINSRSYELMTSSNSVYATKGSIRVGNRVPINFGSTNGAKTMVQVQYEDVGMDIDCFLMPPFPAGEVMLNTRINWQSVVGKDESTGDAILRRLQFSGPALVVPGKPTIIGKVDDVTSNHEYEIEVTVKKIE